MVEPSALRARRERIARGYDARHPAVVPGGLPVPIAGSDQFHDFHAHPEFLYLAGIHVPGSVLTFDPREGWRLFAPVPSLEDRVWVGDGVPLEELAALGGFERVRGLDAFAAWLEAHRGEPLAVAGNDDLQHRPAEYGVPGWLQLEPEIDGEASGRLRELMAEARRAKDADELAAMRRAAVASRAGHLAALRTARPGMTERRVQVEIEAEFFRSGGDRTAYGSIVGSGPNGAILHIAPTARELRDGDIVMVDAGAEVDGYASDVSRTWPVGPRFEGAQRDLYQLVLAVQEQAIHDARPGKEYRELHLEASERLAAGLVDLGILRGDPATLVERDAHALFFPHGLGHMLGLATHDAGGCLAGREKSERFGLKWLRADLPLKPDYVVTIEPGLYFIPALLQDRDRREQYRDAVNWDAVDSLGAFGGIRIEDDVRITTGEPEVLTAAIPKSLTHIEALRREALA